LLTFRPAHVKLMYKGAALITPPPLFVSLPSVCTIHLHYLPGGVNSSFPALISHFSLPLPSFSFFPPLPFVLLPFFLSHRGSGFNWKSQQNKKSCEGCLPYSKSIDDAELFWNTFPIKIYAQLQSFPS
jgi:hypothetical protein